MISIYALYSYSYIERTFKSRGDSYVRTSIDSELRGNPSEAKNVSSQRINSDDKGNSSSRIDQSAKQIQSILTYLATS